MYYKQLPCIYHPNLNITNFCQDQECLMPLCPSCIREHTEYHEDLQTKPSYFNIYEALAQTDTLITNYIAGLQKDKKRNSELIFKVNRLPALIHQKIHQAKTIALKIVEQSFAQLQKDTINTIAKINQQMNVHCLRKSQNLEEKIVTNLRDLYDLAEGLKCESCLSDMIFFLKQKRFEVEDLHTEMSHYLYSNENYEPYIEISKQAQHSLASVIHRMFKLDQKEKNASMGQRASDRPENRSLYENSYHISLTPSKVKKSLYSMEKQKAINTSLKYLPKGSALNKGVQMSSKQRNTSYQNYTEYQEHINRSRQNSKQKTLKNGQQVGSLRQINIKDRQRKVYQPLQDSPTKGLGSVSTRRGAGSTIGRYPNYNKF